jgi:hypothetical protein
MNDSGGIGTLSERSLHAALKQRYSRPGDLIEHEVDGYVIDIVRDGQLIEIQTGNLSGFRRKLAHLLQNHPVHLVLPVAAEKHIVREDRHGKVMGRRRSPKRGRGIDVFAELVGIPNLLMHPDLTIEVVLVRKEVVLRDDGRGSWRRRRWSVRDSRLLGVEGSVTLASIRDFQNLLPEDLPRPFTNADLSKALGCGLDIASQMTYVMRRIGAVTVVGKRDRASLYI